MKILSEHIALTPIQSFLESESWAFYRGASTMDNLNCCINADYAEGGKKEGGFLTEDALSADILMSMAFIEAKFISGLLEKCGWKNVDRDKYEVVGVQSNFWFPQFTLDLYAKEKEEEKNHLRLAQPDGWIAGKNLLVMIETKGMRDGAAFNYAQLAKEYLIAKQECPEQPRILLLLTDEQKNEIGDNFYKVFTESWNQLFKKNGKVWSDKKVKFMSERVNKIGENDDKKEKSPDKEAVDKCFKILTYSELFGYATDYKKNEKTSSQKLAGMIAKTIEWHTPVESSKETTTYQGKDGKEKTKTIVHYKPGTESPSIWSKMLIDLASVPTEGSTQEAQTPLYEFYNGGILNTIVTKAEKDFFTAAAIAETDPIRKAVEMLRRKISKEYVEELYRLYCIQKYWELEKENKKTEKSATVECNYKYYFRDKHGKYVKEGQGCNAQECRDALKAKYKKLNEIFNQKYGEKTGIQSAAVPNVRTLIYFYIRSLMNNFDDAMPGYDFFAFDNKKFFIQN